MLIERVTRDDETRGLVSLGLVECWIDPPPDADAALGEEIAQEVDRLRKRYEGMTAGSIPMLQSSRALYHSLGIDPTRHRPSPEALLRRLLKGEQFPHLHLAVDLANLWAIVSGLSVGLYDAEKLNGAIVARRGRSGESYVGIRKPLIELEGALLLSDDAGPFGNPSADSLRSSVEPHSRHLLFVLFVPVSTEIEHLDRWVAWLRERADAYLGGRSISALLP